MSYLRVVNRPQRGENFLTEIVFRNQHFPFWMRSFSNTEIHKMQTKIILLLNPCIKSTVN